MRRSIKSVYKPRWEAELVRNYSEIQIRQIANEMFEWISAKGDDNSAANFWLNDFAVSKMLTPGKLKQFAVKNEYFNAIFEICKSIQESKLLKMALYKEVNATPAMFILKSVIGSGEDDKPLDIETAKKQVEEIFEQ